MDPYTYNIVLYSAVVLAIIGGGIFAFEFGHEQERGRLIETLSREVSRCKDQEHKASMQARLNELKAAAKAKHIIGSVIGCSGALLFLGCVLYRAFVN